MSSKKIARPAQTTTRRRAYTSPPLPSAGRRTAPLGAVEVNDAALKPRERVDVPQTVNVHHGH